MHQQLTIHWCCCSVLQVVLGPVILGAALNQNFPRAVKQTAPFAPLVAVITVVLIVASVMAQNAAAVTLAGPRLVGAILALHTGALRLTATATLVYA